MTSTPAPPPLPSPTPRPDPSSTPLPPRPAAPSWTPAQSRAERDLAAFWAGARPGAPTAVLVAGAVVGVAGGALLARQRLGLGAALTALAVLGVALPDVWRRRRPGDLALVGWAAALFAMLAVRDAAWVTALCVVVGLLAAAVALTAGRSAPGVLLAPFGAVAALVRALPWAGRGLRGFAGDRGRSVWLAVRTGAVAVALVVVFGALFAGADPLFARLVPRLALDDLPARVVTGLLVAVLAAAAVHLARTATPWADATAPAATPARPTEWLVPVVALDLVVVAFLGVQAGALLAGHDYVKQATGLTYAAYARQGFGQLVAATVLTLVVVAVAARRAPLATAADRLRARLALGVLCAGTLGVVASALRRMALYVDEYGLTRLRLLSTWGEVAMGVVLVLVLVAGWRWRGRWLPRALVHVAAVAMLTLAVANPDALVVRYNGHADVPGGVDTAYLAGLSADAVPALAALDDPERSCLAARLDPAPVEGFADWNLARSSAAAVLAAAATAPCTP